MGTWLLPSFAELAGLDSFQSFSSYSLGVLFAGSRMAAKDDVITTRETWSPWSLMLLRIERVPLTAGFTRASRALPSELKWKGEAV